MGADEETPIELTGTTCGRLTIGSRLWLPTKAFYVGLALVALLNAASDARRGPAWQLDVHVALAISWCLIACVNPRAIRASTVLVDGDGIRFTVSDGLIQRLAWSEIRSVRRTGDAFTVVSGGLFNTATLVQLPQGSDAYVAHAAWARFYRHLVSPRGLQPTPLAQLGWIENTRHR